jgi:transposase
LVNAQHVKNVPGRETDVQDAQWLCRLLEHGPVRASFVPPKPIRERRDLTRYRKSLVWERAREANRLQKLLEDANIKLGDVAADVLGASGEAMLSALCEGGSDPDALAETRQGQAAREAAGAAARARGTLLGPPRAARLAPALPRRLARRDDRSAVGGDRAARAPFRVKA